MHNERVSTKVMPPPPPNYRANFEKGGWRLCERLYGARTDLHLAWQAVTGCVNPRAKRTAVMRRDVDGRVAP